LRFPLGEARRRLGGIKAAANLFLTSDHPTLSFGFEIGKIVKYAGLNCDQLDLILGKKLRASGPHRAQTVRPENRGHHANLTTKSPDAYRRLVPRKWIGLSVTRGEISTEEMKTPRNKSKFHAWPSRMANSVRCGLISPR